MIIKRDLYLNKLISRKNNGLIKVITGIRRSGKSFLLFNLFKNYLINEGVREDHIIELNFDEFDNIKYCDPNNASPYLKGKIVDADMYYFLLDEIQLLNCFESVLNGLLRYNNVDIYVTGSNAKFLSKDVITEFRGRRDQVHVYPLSFSEFYEAKNIDNLFVETYIKDIIDRNNLSETEEMKKTCKYNCFFYRFVNKSQ